MYILSKACQCILEPSRDFFFFKINDDLTALEYIPIKTLIFKFSG